MSAHLAEETLVLLHYGEPCEPDAAAHLAACPTCQSEARRLADVLGMVEVQVPEPDDRFEERTWTRIAWRLRGERTRSRRILGGVAAAAALVVIGLLAGLWISRPTSAPVVDTVATTTAPDTEPKRDRVLLLVVSHHLDRTERVLLEVARTDPGSERPLDLASASDLVAANRLYRLTAADRDPKLTALLEELEPILVEISHAGSDMTAAELETLQKRIEDRGLIFKLKVSGARVRGQKSAGPTT